MKEYDWAYLAGLGCGFLCAMVIVAALMLVWH